MLKCNNINLLHNRCILENSSYKCTLYIYWLWLIVIPQWFGKNSKLHFYELICTSIFYSLSYHLNLLSVFTKLWLMEVVCKFSNVVYQFFCAMEYGWTSISYQGPCIVYLGLSPEPTQSPKKDTEETKLLTGFKTCSMSRTVLLTECL